jgi:hypothetical protein
MSKNTSEFSSKGGGKEAKSLIFDGSKHQK